MAVLVASVVVEAGTVKRPENSIGVVVASVLEAISISAESGVLLATGSASVVVARALAVTGAKNAIICITTRTAPRNLASSRLAC